MVTFNWLLLVLLVPIDMGANRNSLGGEKLETMGGPKPKSPLPPRMFTSVLVIST
jgi:hypothetical protein